MTSVFARYQPKAYPFTFNATLEVTTLVGGVPTDEKITEGWIKTKIADKDDLVREMVAETMAERGVTAEEAVELVGSAKHLNGFKRDAHGLYLEGRNVKAMIKEASNIRWPKERWGPSKKGTRSFFAEHVFVPEQRIPLGCTEPTGIMQRIVHTWRGSSISNDEYVENVTLDFTVVTDHDFKAEEWAMLWLTAEANGLGACRSQGYGRFEVTRWEKAGK
jgi:hypothetical protein